MSNKGKPLKRRYVKKVMEDCKKFILCEKSMSGCNESCKSYDPSGKREKK